MPSLIIGIVDREAYNLMVQLTDVVLAEKLHAHDGKDEDDDTQHEGQVTQGTHRPAHDWDEQVECRPWLG